MTPLEDGTGVRSEGRGATERSSLRLQQGFITQNAADSSVTVWQSHLICLNFFKTSSQARRRPWFVQPLRIDHSEIFMNYLFEFPVDYLWKNLDSMIRYTMGPREDEECWVSWLTPDWTIAQIGEKKKVSLAHLRLSVIPVTLTTALLVCISWVLLLCFELMQLFRFDCYYEQMFLKELYVWLKGYFLKNKIICQPSSGSKLVWVSFCWAQKEWMLVT